MENPKIALVTGASRGIGAAIAQTLGKQGFVVLGTATSEKGAASITQNLESQHIAGKGYMLNITDKEAIESTLKTMADDFGMPDLLINNAGITRDNLLMRMKDEEWESVIATNLSGIFYLSRACLRAMMKKRWGRIVTISSIVGCMGNAGQTNYAAAKAGVEGFSRSLAREVASRGITVNAVAPGYIETDMTRSLTPEQIAPIENAIAMKRVGKPSDIANAVAFLVSDGAAYITGETLHVNGGMYMG
ncbi:MAG: 3-oxoacyl-ACP reductase FabG [Gammaproteobacteria bacterium]